jgi:uncharacterized protein (TIGR02421 family)
MTKLNLLQQTIRDLSERIVEAQKPIRILNALKWPPQVAAEFFAHKCRHMPKMTEELYQQVPLLFDPQKKIEEFYAIERDIRRLIGQFNGAAILMLRRCHEYREVVRLLLARGTSEFPKISQELYGSAQDAFYAGAPTLSDLAGMVSTTLSKIPPAENDMLSEKIYTSEEAVTILTERLDRYFRNSNHQVRVKISDEILADAAAGAEWIKIRRDAMFSERELKVLEVHEGWVHVGTTLNGLSQPICTFLSKGPPSSTISQEGLAIIMEIFTFSSYPARVKRLTNRIQAIDMVEQGANFLDVFHFYCEQGLTKEESFNASARVFRGCVPDKGPFTKDLSYSKGFVLIYNYIRLAIKNGLQEQIPLLFVGKTTLEDLHILADLMDEGLIVAPKYLPPQFNDLTALTAWMSYSIFLNRLSLDKLSIDYKGILLG